jgi:hypothetical protein
MCREFGITKTRQNKKVFPLQGSATQCIDDSSYAEGFPVEVSAWPQVN